MGVKGDQCSITLQLETTSSCNAKCHFCPHKDRMDRSGKVMDMGLFKRLMDEMATIPQVGVMIPQGTGEPLLDPYLDERLAYCKNLDIYTFLFSNGFLMTPERFDRLIENGLDCLVISLNAVNAEQHAKITGVPGKFDKVVAGCEYIIANKPKDFKFSIHAVLSGDLFTYKDAVDFVRKWGLFEKKTGYGKIIVEGNWAGLNRKAPAKESCQIDDDKGCWRANNQIYVMWNGLVTTCCFDPFGRQIFGDLNVQTIREVYNSPKYVQFREDHWNNRAGKYEVCRGCTRI